MKRWIEKIDRGVNNFLLPKFSEIDIFVAVGFIVVLIVLNISKLAENIVLFRSLITGRNFLSAIFVLGMVIYFLAIVFKHLVKREAWKQKEIEFAGYFYYAMMVVAVVASFILSGLKISQTTDYVRVFVVIRACLQLVLLGHLKKTNNSKVYTDRMTDEQIGSYSFLIGVVLIIGVSLILSAWYSPIDVFVLGNAYVGLGLILLRPFIEKFDKGN